LSKYNEIMERVNVTDEMKSRILGNIEEHFSKKKNAKKKSFYLAFGGVAAAALLMIIVRPWDNNVARPINPGTNSVGEGSTVLGVNPMQDYASAEELSKAAGFNVPEITSLPFKVSETEYMTLGEGFAQITYLSDDDRLIYRKSTDKEDNSGNYNPYDYVGEVSVNDIKATVKGTKDALNLAIWNDGTYEHSIYVEKAVDKDVMVKMIEEVIEDK
jgi:hypothetical protein